MDRSSPQQEGRARSGPAPPPTVLAIRLLGHPDVSLGGTTLDVLASPRLQSLLGYLVLHRGSAPSRQHLAFTFWPDSSEPQARTNLRQALHHLRRSLPDPDRFLRVTGQSVQWRADAPADVDVVTFEGAAGDVADAPLEALERAAAAYRGPLLPGCYEDWVEPERQRLERAHLAVLDRLVAVTETTGDVEASTRWAEERLRCDPLDEGAYRDLMRLHLRAGRRAQAVRVYHECVSTLHRELGVPPSPETAALHERLGGPRPPTGAVARTAPTALVGREDEQRLLATCWQDAATGRAHLVLVGGEAGIGKSRLVDDLRLRCARQGVATASARAYESEGSLPYAPVAALLRSAALRPSVERLDGVWRRELARLLPELGSDRPQAAGAPGDDAGARTRLFEATARAVTSVGDPLLLVVDDLQWADPETLALLHFLLRWAPAAPVLLVATARLEEVQAGHPLSVLVDSLRALDAVVEVPLDPLRPVAARALAAQLSRGDDATVERLVAAAGGNPLFLVELARSGLATSPAGAGASPAALPPRVRSVISARLETLPPAARQLVDVAAVIGRAFTVEALVRLLPGQDDDGVVASVDLLWHRHLVLSPGNGRYDFSHDLIREVAYRTLGPARRRRLHLRVADVLRALHPDDLDAIAGQLAAHHERGGDPEGAVAWYRRAVDAARRLHAHDEVLVLTRRALDLLAALPTGSGRDEHELGLLVPMGVAVHAGSGLYDNEAWAVLERAVALRAERDLPPDPSTLRVLANRAITYRQYPEAQRHGEALLALATDSGDPFVLTEAHYVLGVTAFWLGSLEHARHQLSRALESYRSDRAAEHVERFGQDPGAICLVRLAWTCAHLGRAGEAAELHERALAHARRVDHPFTQAYTERFAAWMAIDEGDDQRLLALVDDFDRRCEDHRFVVAITHVLGGWAAVVRGHLEPGSRRIEEGIRLARSWRSLMVEALGLLLLARARARLGSTAGALEGASGLCEIAPREIPFLEAHAFQLLGELLHASGAATAEVDAALRRSAATAERQGSVLLAARARDAQAAVARGPGTPTPVAQAGAGFAPRTSAPGSAPVDSPSR